MPISPFSPSLLFLDVAPINQTTLNPGLGGGGLVNAIHRDQSGNWAWREGRILSLIHTGGQSAPVDSRIQKSIAYKLERERNQSHKLNLSAAFPGVCYGEFKFYNIVSGKNIFMTKYFGSANYVVFSSQIFTMYTSILKDPRNSVHTKNCLIF